MAGWPPGIEPRASERTASLVALAMAGATAARKSVSRSVKSRPGRTMPAAPQHAPSARNNDAKLLIDPQRPPDVVEPEAPIAVTVRQVRQLGHRFLAKRKGGKGMRFVAVSTRIRRAMARTPAGCRARRWSWC